MTTGTLGRLKQRGDFLRAAKGSRTHSAAFSLQAGVRRAEGAKPVPSETQARIGFTVTRKVGNAVERNRIRRRLREAVRLCEVLPTSPQTDYVIVARREALSVPFGRLMSDLAAAIRRSGERAAQAGANRRRGVV